jgi:hypothetical protein
LTVKEEPYSDGSSNGGCADEPKNESDTQSDQMSEDAECNAGTSKEDAGSKVDSKDSGPNRCDQADAGSIADRRIRISCGAGQSGVR